MEHLFLFLLLLQAGDVERNPGPSGRRSVAKGPTPEEEILTLQARFAEMETKIKELTTGAEENKTGLETKIDGLESKIDETLTESINTVKQDYDSQISQIRDASASFQEASGSNLGELQQTLESMISCQVDALRADLYDKIEANDIDSKNRDKDLDEKMEANNISSINRDKELRNEVRSIFNEMKSMSNRMETINQIMEDIQEKMYDFEEKKKNNLIFYGVPQEPRETSEELRQKIVNLVKLHMHMRRDIPVAKCNRIHTGPEVQGTRPVLVTFESFRDREDILKNSKVLRRSSVTVTEDLSKKTRESRVELRKFMRQVKKKNPERYCHIEYDKLYLDNKVFVWNEISGQVVEISEMEKDGRNSSLGTKSPLLRGYSLSTPNISTDPDLLERIRELERQIQIQKDTIQNQQNLLENKGVELRSPVKVCIRDDLNTVEVRVSTPAPGDDAQPISCPTPPADEQEQQEEEEE